METQTPLFRQSIESQQLAKALADKSHDPLFTYRELSTIAGVPEITERRGPLVTAQRTVRREHRIKFAVIRGVGIKRLSDAEIVASRAQTRRKIGNAARESQKDIGCIVRENLSRDEKTQLDVESAALGIVSACMSTKGQGALKQLAIEKKGGPLEIGDLTAAFK